MREFTDAELQERVIELVIASTPMELFRRDLLAKGKTLTLETVLKEGRQHEAASKGTLKLEAYHSQLHHNIDFTKQAGSKASRKPCGNCGRNHKFRECPAFNSNCHACGKKGHWKEHCRSTRSKDAESDTACERKHTGMKFRKKKRNKEIDAVESEDDDCEYEMTENPNKLGFFTLSKDPKVIEDDETVLGFLEVIVSTSTIDSVATDTAYAVLDVQVPRLRGQHTLKVKLDSGACANALPTRTFRQMYGDINPATVLKPVDTATLSSYSGHKLK